MEYKQAQWVDRLDIELTEAQESKLNHWLDHKKTSMEQDREPFVTRSQKFMFNWDDFVTFVRKGPWESSSNLHMPLTAIMVKTYYSRLYNIFSAPDTVSLSPREGSDGVAAEIARKLRDWYMFDYINGYKGIRGFTREICYDTVTVGFGVGMKDWISKQRKVLDLEPNELKREMDDLTPQMEENAKLIPSDGLQTEEEEANTKVSVKPYKEVQKIVTAYECTRMRSVPFEDVYFPNDIPESNDLDHPTCIIVESEMTVGEIKMRSKQGEWDIEKAKQIKEEGGRSFSSTRSQNIKQQRSILTGYNSINSNYDNEIRIIQYCFCTYDIDDDGMDEEIIVVRSESKKILKVNWLDRVSPSGRRPIFKFDCFSKPRQAYSRGIPEFMYPLNEEMDMHHNMRNNAMALQTCPFGSYKSSSSLKRQPIRIAPGKFIPVDETSDLKVLNFPLSATALNGEEDRLWHYAERLASVSSLSQGIVPNNVGPIRSTSGVLAMLQQMDKEFKPTVDQCADQWKKMEIMILEDLDSRISPAIKMRVLGASIDDFVDKSKQSEVIEANKALSVNAGFDVKINVADAIMSDEIKRSEAKIILDSLIAPTIAHQMGIINPESVHKAYDEWLRSYGKDPSNYGIKKPDFIMKPLTLYQEIQYCAQGQVPPMSMQDDHQSKAQMLQNFMQEQAYLEAKQSGLYSPSVDDAMIKTIKKHLILFEQLQPKGLPNPSGENGQNVGETLAGNAPQQGGENGGGRGSPNGQESEDSNGERGMGDPREAGRNASQPVDQ